MERTKIQLPDVINCSVDNGYSQIPNELLRNAELSCKAKLVLCLFLSNRKGWMTRMSTLKDYMKEGETAIKTAMAELIQFGYAVKVIGRDSETKIIRGTVWCFCSSPFTFDFEPCFNKFKTLNLEITNRQEISHIISLMNSENRKVENRLADNPTSGKATTNNTNSNNTNIVKPDGFTPSVDADALITQNYFEKFWKIYPKKTDKGKALDAWKKLINRNNGKDRPTWIAIKTAIRAQIKSERWSVPSYIPNPATWINQNRWLDDPSEMKLFKRDSDQPIKKYQGGYRSPGMVYKQPDEIV